MDPNNGLVWFIYSLMFSVQCSVFSVQCSVFSVCCCENFESCFSVCCCVFPFASSDADASVKSTDFGISVFCKPAMARPGGDAAFLGSDSQFSCSL
ncbi:hypothetical protein Bca101_071463 [Brassica carinata]